MPDEFEGGRKMRTVRTTRISNKIAFQFAFALLLLAGIPVSAQVVITPSTPPVVTAGQTITFAASVVEGGGVTWSCVNAGNGGTCLGKINSSTGAYTAPAHITSNQSYGGYQLLPNDHIYNTRIDSLPVNSSSDAWIAGAGAIPVNYLQSFPINYINGSAPTQNMLFEYTASNNGTFQIPTSPGLRVECGTLVLLSLGCDRHMFAIDTTTGTFQEIYNLVPPGIVSNCPSAGLSLCTAGSGVRYSNSTYDLPNAQGGGVDAAGLYIMPLMLRLQELEQAVATGSAINHATRFTLQNGYICGSSNANACGGNAGGTRHIWPATAEAFAGAGVVPYGARFRLKSSFNISNFSPIAQILLTQLKQYGIILADGGYGWQINTEYTRWPASYVTAFNEIARANIGPSNFEAVDESALESSPTSGATTAGEIVVATGIKNPAHAASQHVVLTGITITLPKDELYIQAGTPAQQLSAFIHGLSDTRINWTMSPTVGTLSSSGLYTPPANVGSATVTTVTATSAADPTVAATLQLTVFPSGSISLMFNHSPAFTDSHGNLWSSNTGDDGCPGQTYTDPNVTSYSGDNIVYRGACMAGNDMRVDISVPNGTYNIRALFSEFEPAVTGAGQRLENIEVQGSTLVSNYDIYAISGGMSKPVDLNVQATVANGSLSFVVRHIKGDTTMISALQITPTSLTGTAPPTPPAPPPTVGIINVK
jgi:hypothetical protein